MSQREAWKQKPFQCKEYSCPHCKRNKGMLYLFPDNSIRYVCFCGSNASLFWIDKRYEFDLKTYLGHDIEETRLRGEKT